MDVFFPLESRTAHKSEIVKKDVNQSMISVIREISGICFRSSYYFLSSMYQYFSPLKQLLP